MNNNYFNTLYNESVWTDDNLVCASGKPVLDIGVYQYCFDISLVI